ncbi:MAG: HRDC domain-containing protein [Pirellulales bacterium]|nr:HRDC domain-containing protein [Pirellulales bacterium]
MPHRTITTDAQLGEYCRELAQADSIGVDTEFVSEHTYRPQLCLVQVVAGGRLALIDAMVVEDLAPFWDVLASEGHETIVHAGRGEIEFSIESVGRMPAGLIDVQIAAGLAGLEYPAGYGSLVTKLLERKHQKHETRTDWRRRPLTARQIDYALDDVRHLHAIRDAIVARLEKLHRAGWLVEEMENWRTQVRQSLTQERWRRVSGCAGLDPRGLAILRELWQWREGEAQRRNVPVRRVLRDDLLVELARRKTDEPKRIGAVRGLERGDLRRQLPEMSRRIARAMSLPDDQCPEMPSRERSQQQLSVLGQFFFSALGSRCRELDLAPGLVGTPGDVRDWINHRNHRGRGCGEPPALARGWRAEVVGDLFEELLAGRIAVRVENPASEHPLAFLPTEPRGRK